MALEIERKHLVTGAAWRSAVVRTQRLRQGYLTRRGALTVRVRIADETGTLTFKGPRIGVVREEIEFPVPLDEARRLLAGCGGRTVEKLRHRVEALGMTWVVDEFIRPAAGLVLAEIELDHPDQTYDLPEWAGEEVTLDPRYSNSHLAGLRRSRGLGSSEEPARERAGPGRGRDEHDARHDAPGERRPAGGGRQDHLRHPV
jgi:adenylate cyclase